MANSRTVVATYCISQNYRDDNAEFEEFRYDGDKIFALVCTLFYLFSNVNKNLQLVSETMTKNNIIQWQWHYIQGGSRQGCSLT